MNRRTFIKNTAVTISGLTLLKVSSYSNQAAAAELVSTTDTMAVSLKYVEDAAEASTRTDKDAICANCQFYSDTADTDAGPCSLFSGKAVKAKGWCTAWSAK